MKWLRHWRRRRLLQRQRLPEEEWQAVVGLPALAGLNAAELHHLRELTLLFLHEKTLTPAGGLELNAGMRITIAAQACLPILALGLDYYHDWSALIIYPEGFWSPHRSQDAAGVVHSGYEARVGEAWDRGPVILSWEDVQAAAWNEGFNVVVHECAHKLDLLNGAVNGMPPLHRAMTPAAWTTAFTAAYEDLCRRVQTDAETALHPYAADSPGEFFAVASEAFFGLPAVLQNAYPAVYHQLCAFYRQDPALRQGQRLALNRT